MADTHYQRILHYSPQGELLAMWGEDGTRPGQFIFARDVVASADGETLWICEHGGSRGRVMQFTRGGELVREIVGGLNGTTPLLRPMGLVIDPRGRIVVVDTASHKVVVYSPDGTELTAWGEAGDAPGQLHFPQDVALADDGTLFIVEYGNSRVSRFTVEGEYLGSWGVPGHATGELFSPWGVSVGPSGELVVVDTYNNRIQVLHRPAKAFARGGAA
jgi:DNA-binding beta-propeller fold protein YncE